jgi:hypothetical protein
MQTLPDTRAKLESESNWGGSDKISYQHTKAKRNRKTVHKEPTSPLFIGNEKM